MRAGGVAVKDYLIGVITLVRGLLVVNVGGVWDAVRWEERFVVSDKGYLRYLVMTEARWGAGGTVSLGLHIGSNFS